MSMARNTQSGFKVYDRGSGYVVSRRATGHFSQLSKTIRTEHLCKKSFPPDGQTSQSIYPVSGP